MRRHLGVLEAQVVALLSPSLKQQVNLILLACQTRVDELSVDEAGAPGGWGQNPDEDQDLRLKV